MEDTGRGFKVVRTRELLGAKEVIGTLRDKFDSWLGRSKYSASVPVMDGPLQANRGLEEAETLISAPALDNLVAVGDVLYFSSDARLIRRHAVGALEELAPFQTSITFLPS